MADWHVITPEYPPQIGGVSDYTRAVVAGLAAAGETVTVWCPPAAGTPVDPGVTVRRELGTIGPADLRRLGAALDAEPKPRRLLVQWVPHGFGMRAMNVTFCLWLWKRARIGGDRVELMVHEPFMPFDRRSWRRSTAAAVQRAMTIVLLAAAARVFVSTPEWERFLRPFALGRDFRAEWLPIQNSVDVVSDPEAVAAVRARFASDGKLVGHFSTCGGQVAPFLERAVPDVLGAAAGASFLLVGRDSTELASSIVASSPGLEGRVHASGLVDERGISLHVSACDVLVQLYPDGITSRRGSAMAGLAHGVAVVTNAGVHTESMWAESGAVILTRDTAEAVATVAGLLADDAARGALADAGRRVYESRFGIDGVIEALRRAEPSAGRGDGVKGDRCGLPF